LALKKYESLVRKSETADAGDHRAVSRRMYDSYFAKFIQVLSIVLGIYTPVGLLLGLLLLFGAVSSGQGDDDQSRSNRRQMGLIAAGVGVSGIVAGYGSYRLWSTASNLRRNNRRRAKGLI
jgi:hypothetical protein